MLDRGHQAKAGRCVRDRVDQHRPQPFLAVEQDVALVAEVAEIRTFGHVGSGRDLGRGRLFVAVLLEQLQRRLLQPAVHLGAISGHAFSLLSVTDL